MSLRTYMPMPNPFIEAIEVDDPDAPALAVDWGLIESPSQYPAEASGYLVRLHGDGETSVHVWASIDGWIEQGDTPR